VATMNHPVGSVWRKWDLQVHAPLGRLYDGYKVDHGADVVEKCCDEIEMSDVQVFGITDYFAYGAFDNFIKRFQKKYPESGKQFFFNLELRLNETVNRQLEEVNVHLIFNPESLDKIDKFLSLLRVVKTGKDETPIMCSELRGDDFTSATVTRADITNAFENTFGKKAERQDHFIVITAANNDGLRPERGKKRKEGICDEIDKYSDAFLGGSQNVEYYLKTDRYEDEALMALKKPVFACSDAHSFDDIHNFLGKRHVKEVEKDGKQTVIIEKDVTWIKADTTYEGLKQTLYEPEAGERVCIGPAEPDRKKDYQIISKITFGKSDDFPSTITFNRNLCSIIGSRSSGKSALLAYIAHSVNAEDVEQLIPGPGEGDEYHWNKIAPNHSIEWANGKTNEDSPGSVVYVPQNYLFERSKDPNAIKQKLEPVLFRVLPDFAAQYMQVGTDIDEFNNIIAQKVHDWFAAADQIQSLDGQLKHHGDKKAIEQQQNAIDAEIEALREKNKFSEADVQRYQQITGQISVLNLRKTEIEKELALHGMPTKQQFFNSAKIILTPALSLLPPKLQTIINQTLSAFEGKIIEEVNKNATDYKDALTAEKDATANSILRIQGDNKELITKYQKHIVLEKLVNTSAELKVVLEKIKLLEISRNGSEVVRTGCETAIHSALISRKSKMEGLVTAMESSDQGAVAGIEFGIEYDFSADDVGDLGARVNLREKTEFVDRNELQIQEIRSQAAKFLRDIYSGQQRIIARQDKKDVAIRALQLTEKVLFTAKMEGDKIGGFSEPTMTPGKRALFALKLILAESDDKWPLLIDQPEDDLDSRSIYDEVVPFLKRKKKERQIIMVSHNANLVIGSDSEQLIVANRHGNDRKNQDGKEFNYLTGSLEFTQAVDNHCADTLRTQGVCEHACSILDGGKAAFENRKNKYHIK
jgi:hypothetical protein